MKIKNRFLLILLMGLFCVSNEQVYAVKLSTIGTAVGVCTAISIATLVGIDMAFELQDVTTAYHPISKFKQDQSCFMSEIIDQLHCNNDIQYFSDVVKAGLIDHTVITVNPLWFGYKGYIFDRRQARVHQLFKKAKELAPCVIVVEENEFTPLLSSLYSKFQATDTFVQEMRALEESSALILVDEVLIDVMMEQLHENKPEFKKNVLSKNITEIEKLQYLETKFQQMQISSDIDASLALSLLQNAQYNWGKLIKFISLTQDNALKDHADIINFKHIYKANRADQSFITNIEQQIYVACNGGKKRSAYHESAHAMLGVNLDTGIPVLGMSILPYQGSGGHVSYAAHAGFDTMNQTDIQKQNWIMVCLAGGASEQEFGFPIKKDFKDQEERFQDFAGRPGVFNDLVAAYRVAFTIVGDKQFENEEIKTQHVHAMIKDAFDKTVEYVHEHKSELQCLAQEVLQEEILSVNEIRKLIGSN